MTSYKFKLGAMLASQIVEAFRSYGRSLWTESKSSASKAGQCSLWLNAPEYLDEFLFVVAGIGAAVLAP